MGEGRLERARHSIQPGGMESPCPRASALKGCREFLGYVLDP
jgi:hypothetical protein